MASLSVDTVDVVNTVAATDENLLVHLTNGLILRGTLHETKPLTLEEVSLKFTSPNPPANSSSTSSSSFSSTSSSKSVSQGEHKYDSGDESGSLDEQYGRREAMIINARANPGGNRNWLYETRGLVIWCLTNGYRHGRVTEPELIDQGSP